jgi:hypothetical protein
LRISRGMTTCPFAEDFTIVIALTFSEGRSTVQKTSNTLAHESQVETVPPRGCRGTRDRNVAA